MRVRSFILVILVLSVVVMSTAAQSLALSMPSISGDYKLKATSPGDDPLTGQVEVLPGQDITVEAVATLTYDGITIMSPPITITTILHLLKGSAEIASETQSTRVDPMLMEDGKSYTKSGSGKITIPSDIAPGTYKLKCNAVAEASMLGQSMTRTAQDSFTVQVLELPEESPGNGHTVSQPPAAPVNFNLKKLIRHK